MSVVKCWRATSLVSRSDVTDPKSDIRRTEEAQAKQHTSIGWSAIWERLFTSQSNVYKLVAPNIGIVDGPFEYLTVGGAGCRFRLQPE
jgi:hypothetical protein